jgi:hypothetical protein
MAPASVPVLQRACGNRATTGLLVRRSRSHRSRAGGTVVQAEGTRRNVMSFIPGLTKSRAMAAHKKDRKRLHEIVQEGLRSEDQRTRNACEWVGPSGRSKLHALTPRADTVLRTLGKVGKTAYFGAKHPVYKDGTYVADPPAYDAGDVEIQSWGVGGYQSGDKIAIPLPRLHSKEAILTTIRHEVQHAADLSDAELDRVRTRRIGLAGAALKQNIGQKWFQHYMTEYRAYSFEGKSRGSMHKTVNKLGYEWRERQYNIFKHIRGGYSHTKAGWKHNPDLGPEFGNKTFRQAVVEFGLPKSINPQNSVRVHDFVKALQMLNPTRLQHLREAKRTRYHDVTHLRMALNAMEPTRQTIRDLWAAARSLEPGEKRMILANDLIDLKEHLGDDILETAIREHLQKDALPFMPPTQERYAF